VERNCRYHGNSAPPERRPSSSTCTARPDAGFVRLDEVFHLEDQLAFITQQE
jgi:hypothetical protein